jgi:hypothetical protein
MATPKDDPALNASLARLGDVLADVRARTDDYCRACYSDADGTALSGPLERIPDNLLSAVPPRSQTTSTTSATCTAS